MTNVVEYLEKTIEEFPDKKAIIDENGSISFFELRRLSRRLASQIIKDRFFKEAVVVFLPKGKECIVSFLAAAYSGNFYVPISTDMPVERIKKIVNTVKPSVVITNKDFYKIFKNVGLEIKYYLYENIEGYIEDEQLIIKTLPKIVDMDLLYVLFTSGSTGEPKGVCMSHYAIIDRIEWACDTFDINENDSIGNQSPFYFDNSILDIYGMLKSGATMHIIPHELFSYPVALLEYLNEHKISLIFWVPSALILVANLRALREVKLQYTKKILFCGEVMPNKQLNIWRQYNPDAVYANLYGTTEIPLVCTYYIVDRIFNDEDLLPIGLPCKNIDILVLNEENNKVEVNEPGELCVRGGSLTKGYYNNIKKTEEALVQNPLNQDYVEWIYKTGDIVKYNEYGELIYLTRKDFQIKHKGHRIELGEIEAMANSLEYISNCCCLYDKKRNRIIFFYADAVEEEKIIGDLEKKIPDYMIPGHCIKLEFMPMNSNGKIDRMALKDKYNL